MIDGEGSSFQPWVCLPQSSRCSISNVTSSLPKQRNDLCRKLKRSTVSLTTWECCHHALPFLLYWRKHYCRDKQKRTVAKTPRTRTNARPAEQCSGTVHLKRAGMSAKSLLHFIVSLLGRWLEETIKAAALKDCLCCVLPNAWIMKHMFLNGLRAFTERIRSQSQGHLNIKPYGTIMGYGNRTSNDR